MRFKKNECGLKERKAKLERYFKKYQLRRERKVMDTYVILVRQVKKN